MTARAARTLALSAVALFGCNGVWGLDEGRLVGDGGAGSGASGSGASGAGASGSGGQTGSGGGGTTTTGSAGGSGVGGGCVESVGLENGDFTFWATSDPDHWLQQKYNCMVAASTLPSLTDGLSIGLTTVGANAYGGFYQTQSFLGWNSCVRLSGDGMKSTGTGRFRAIAEFNQETLEITLPGGADFEAVSATCQPAGPIDTFTVRLRVDQVPEGGTVTYRMHEVRFDEVCCTGTEPACPSL